MSKNDYKTSSKRPRGASDSARSDHGIDEGRPFAEIRKNLHNLLSLISMHRWAFLVPFCLVSSGAFIISLYYPRMYSASTSFERRNDPVMFDLPMSAGAAASFAYFRTTMHTDLTAVPNMVQVADNLGLTKHLQRGPDGNLTPAAARERNSIARALGSRLTVTRSSPSEQLDIISISYTGPDSTIGKRLVEEVKKVYIRRSMEWLSEFLQRQRDYFQEESAHALVELQAAQREETALRLAHPHANPTDPSELSRKISQLELEKRELGMRQRDYQAELVAMQQNLAALESQPQVSAAPEPGVRRTVEALGPEALRLRAALQELRTEMDRLRSTRGMTDEHPQMRELLAKAQQIETAFEAQRTGQVVDADQVVGPRIQTVDPAVSSWLSEQARLRVQIAAQQSKLADLDISLRSNESAMAELVDARNNVFQHQEEFGEVMGSVAKSRQRYQSVESTLMAIEPMINAVSQDRLMQFSEGQPARGASTPISPKSKTVLILSLLAGIAAGTGLVILAEILDHVYRSSSQVARSLGLPVLEAIDEIVTPTDKRRLLIRRMVYSPLIIILLLSTVGLTGSMAYLSIERPWTYQQVRKFPQTAARVLGLSPETPPPVRHDDN